MNTTMVLAAGTAGVALLILVWLLSPGKEKHDSSQSQAATDAEHFANLLVNEISTYHKDRLSQARRDRNILSAFDKEISSARRIYEGRFGVPGANERDYFSEALLRILARGNKAALGGRKPISRLASG